MCGYFGSSYAYFFLDSKYCVEVVGDVFEFFEGFDEDEYGDAVVDGFGVDAVAHFDEGTFAGDDISDGYEAFDLGGFHAKVDEVVFDFGCFVAVGWFHDVDGFAAHDSDDVFFAVDYDSLCGEGFGVESAEGMEAGESVVVDVGDDECDFVHVGGDHDFFAGFAFFEGDDVAEVVYFDVIDEAFDFFEDELTDGLFVSGSAGSFADIFEKGYVECHCCVGFCY